MTRGGGGAIQGPGLNNISFSGFDRQPTEPTKVSETTETTEERGSGKSCCDQRIPKPVRPEDNP